MALVPETAFPGQITPGNVNYPLGEARDITTPGDGLGTPFEFRGINDIYGMQQALLAAAGITASGLPDTALVSQYLEAMRKISDLSFPVLADALASKLVEIDNQIFVEEREAGRGGGAFWRAVDAGTVTDNDMNVVTSTEDAGIALVQNEWAVKPSISFMFDDASRDHFEIVLPIFEARKLPFSLAVSPKFTDDSGGVPTRMTTSELLVSQKKGVEIVNHGMTHADLSATTSAERVMAEVETARQWLEDRGLNTVGFQAASSAVNQDVLAPIYARMSYAMTVSSANVVDVARINVGAPQYSLSRWTMDGVAASSTIATIKEAIRFGSALIVYDHVIAAPATDLNAVLDFLATVPELIDIQLPKDLVSRFCGIEMKQIHHKDETQIFNDTSGWSIAAGLGGAITTQEIQLTPTVTGAQTLTRDLPCEPNKGYMFSSNVRSGSWTGTVSMGVHCLDSGDSIIADYSVEGGDIDYDGENLQRHSVELHTPDNAVKLRLFYRVNPTIADATTLLIRDPAVYTGRRLLFVDEKFTPVEDSAAPFDLNLANGERDFFLRLDGASSTVNAPTNQEVLDTITLYMRANGSNRAIVWDAVFNPNPNTVFNTNSVGGIMLVQFRYYRDEWWQLGDTAWV